jgi:hypothetical protein
MALEELEDLVSPIDNANDLHVLGALAPLVRTALDAGRAATLNSAQRSL